MGRLRRRKIWDAAATDDYNLVRKVYRAMVVRSRYDYIKSSFKAAKGPAMFRMARQLEARRTLPSMVDDCRKVVATHEGISDLIADQLCSGEEACWLPSVVDMSPSGNEMMEAVKISPVNTGRGFDDIGYPFVRRWISVGASDVRRLVNFGLRHDIPDWHMGEVVLIPKADKPRYDVVKSWRMIHLLPTIAKIVERIVMLRIAATTELGETQFGSRRKRSVHDAMAIVYEFLEHNRNMRCALMTVDVEGGFDKVDLDNLCDFLVARSCDDVLVAWVRRWAKNRRVRFRFNGRVSKIYHLNKGIPQGSPLSPFLFGAYIADIFTPRMRYGPSLHQLVVSYVDDAAIMVAADSRTMAVAALTETFEDCRRIAGARGMGFSVIKTKWIGFGDCAWDGMEIDGHCLMPEASLQVLGFYFNMYNNFSCHVKYWLERGLGVRRRIMAMGRRFGEGALGAYGTLELFRSTYLPTVYYGLEFLAGHRSYVKEIQRHVNDCIRSLFRTSFMMANNILMAEFGVVADTYTGPIPTEKSRCQDG